MSFSVHPLASSAACWWSAECQAAIPLGTYVLDLPSCWRHLQVAGCMHFIARMGFQGLPAPSSGFPKV